MAAAAAAVVAILLRHRFAQPLHLEADPLDLRDGGVDAVPMLGEMRAALLGQAIELARALDVDGGVADLLEIGQRWINHAGARHVEAVGKIVEGLDDLVAVARLLRDERKDHELQVLGRELAAAAEAVSAAFEIVSEAAGKAAPAAPMAATGEMVCEPGHEARK